MVQTTGVRQNGVSSPGRGAGLKVTFVKFHAATAKQFKILFAKLYACDDARVVVRCNAEPSRVGKDLP